MDSFSLKDQHPSSFQGFLPPWFLETYDKILELLAKTEGRDKLTKLLQFKALLLAAIFKLTKRGASKVQMATDFHEAFREARKLLRLLKWTIEYNRMVNLFEKRPADYTDLDIFLLISIRLLLMGYWICDNIDTLLRLRLINESKMMNFALRGKTCWSVSLILHAALNLRMVAKSRYTRQYKQRQLELLMKEGKDSRAVEELRETVQQMEKRSLHSIVGIVKVVGDLFVAGRDLNIHYGFFRPTALTEGVVSLGGILSASISLWGMYQYHPSADRII